MNSPSVVSAIFVALVAGLTSALLSGVLMPGSMSFVLLMLLGPLPLFLAGFGWHSAVAALGGVFGGLMIDFSVSDRGAIAYLGSLAAPTALTCFLSERWLGRQGHAADGLHLGKIGVILVFLAAIIVVGSGLWVNPDYAAFKTKLGGVVREIVSAMFAPGGRAAPGAPTPQSMERMIGFMSGAMLPISSFLMLFTLTLSGTIAMKIVDRSKRLSFAKPDFRAFRLPGGALILFALALFVAPQDSFTGIFATSVALGVAFLLMLQGLAVLHARSIGMNGRIGILGSAWALLILFGIPSLIFIAIGIADHLMNFRTRRPVN